MRPRVSIATSIAHLLGPGKLKVVNGRLAYTARALNPVRLDPSALTTVMCYGDVGVTDEAFALLFRHRVQVSWLSPSGQRCHGRLVRGDADHASLRLRQHRALAAPDRRLAWARRLVAAKLDAQSEAARHHQRHGVKEAGPIRARIAALRSQLDSAGPTPRTGRGGVGRLVRVIRLVVPNAVGVPRPAAAAPHRPGQRFIKPGIYVSTHPDNRPLRGAWT